MILAHMMAVDEDALICDMAETYTISDYQSLPVRLAAIFACGLRDTSRIKQRLANVNIATEELLMAGMYDRLNWLIWSKTTNGQKGIGAPEPITDILLGRRQESEAERFMTGAEYEKRRRELLKGGNNGK